MARGDFTCNDCKAIFYPYDPTVSWHYGESACARCPHYYPLDAQAEAERLNQHPKPIIQTAYVHTVYKNYPENERENAAAKVREVREKSAYKGLTIESTQD